MTDAVDLAALAIEDNSNAHGKQAQPSEETGHARSLQLMRTYLQNEELSCQESDEKTLERFLATNSWDPKKASDALVNHHKWWWTFAPLGCIPEDEINIERKKEKLCLQGYDKKGRTIGVYFIVRHDAFDRDLEEFKRYIVYSFEKAISSTKHVGKELTVIVDSAGWGFKSADIHGYLSLLDIMQDRYINHVGKIILIHIPFLFWAAYKVTSPFFNDATRERMLFVEDKDLQSVLLHEIDEDQLPDIYGGRMALVPA